MTNWHKRILENLEVLSQFKTDEEGYLLVAGDFGPDSPLHFVDVWDASGGDYPPATKEGQFWIISVAGTIGGVEYHEHDWIVYACEDPEKWVKVDNSDLGTDHALLSNLNWSVAGHIMDTDLLMRGNTIVGNDIVGGNLTLLSSKQPGNETGLQMFGGPAPAIFAAIPLTGQNAFNINAQLNSNTLNILTLRNFVGAWRDIFGFRGDGRLDIKDTTNTYTASLRVHPSSNALQLLSPLNMNSLQINDLADPTLDQDAATKKYVDDNLPTIVPPQTFYVSQARGSDADGDGWSYPYATVQKALDEAEVRGWSEYDIIIDSSVKNQDITVYENTVTQYAKVHVFGTRDLFGSPVFAFNRVILANNVTFSCDNVSINTIEQENIGDSVYVFLEDSLLNGINSPRDGLELYMSSCYLLGDATKWVGILSALPFWYGYYSFITTAGVPTGGWIFKDGLDAASSRIKKVADPTDAQDAATKTYVDRLEKRSWRTAFSYTNGGNTINLTDFTDAGTAPIITFGVRLVTLAYDSRVQVTPLITSLTHNGTHWVAIVRCNKTFFTSPPATINFDECATGDVDIMIIAGGE